MSIPCRQFRCLPCLKPMIPVYEDGRFLTRIWGSLSIPWRQILFSSTMLFKKTDALILAYVVQSSVDSSRRYWTRKLIQSNVRPPCGEQWNMCRGKRKSSYKTTTVSPSPEGLPIRNENLLASYRLPRRSVAAAAHFESNRMVPTGPNPLHNSNRSQVIFPWHTPWWYGLGVTQFFFVVSTKRLILTQSHCPPTSMKDLHPGGKTSCTKKTTKMTTNWLLCE